MFKPYIRMVWGAGLLLLGLVIAYFFPWRLINWGNIGVRPSRMVTVTGTATTQTANQVATYTAGVNAVNDDKDKAMAEVNEKVTALMTSLKDFGIQEADIRTQNLNIYQTQETYYEEGRQKQRLGQWNVNNQVEVTLRDMTKAQDLSDLLSKSGANNVYGPNFGLDETQEEDVNLLNQAVENARQKALAIASANKARLGEVLQVVEGQSSSPVVPYLKGEMGGGGGPVSPGSSTTSKTVTVTFELK